MADDKLQSIVEKAVREWLKDTRIERVDAVSDIDHDGDSVVRVTIVLASRTQPDIKRLVSLSRFLRPRLEDAHIDAFPLISYISKRDASRLAKLAAA